uniref:Uncharacterized protein LOC104237950 n=1 Tax=Nicotiana sylvestris TaxID=4096 RepID=A0A1U7XEK5_NICSY|nr:PREDICTED: uncharacterized protein LOC104237950 [Nicotiana sylvestris]
MWNEFANAFMDHFLPTETREALSTEFENLKQGKKSVWEYHMDFARLSKYVILMMPTMEARTCRFVQGLSPLVINKAATTALNSDMNYGKIVVFAQATETCKMKNRMEREGSNRARSADNPGDSFGGRRPVFRVRAGHGIPSSSTAATSSVPLPTRGTLALTGRGAARVVRRVWEDPVVSML